MNYIVFDLEATCWRGRPPGLIQEVIEIGAVKVNLFGENESTFNAFVKPVRNPILSSFCRKLTHIEQNDINRAKTFDIVIDEFQVWAGILDEEEYVLCSWGDWDPKQLRINSDLFQLDVDWIAPTINLRDQYQRLKKLPNAVGLSKAVKREGFEFDGQAHRAIYDAFNTAKICARYIEEWKY